MAREYVLQLHDATGYQNACSGLEVCRKQRALHRPQRYPCTLHYWWEEGPEVYDELNDEYYHKGFCSKLEVTYGY